MQENRKVEVVEYRPEWPRLFLEEAVRIQQVITTVLIRLHHIGSTSIAGMAAKPTIDLLAEVEDLAALDKLAGGLTKLGYEALGEYGIPCRRFFVKDVQGERLYNLHCYQKGDPEIDRYIRFKEYLRKHPEEALSYAALKKKLAEQFPNDMFQYTKGKTERVKAINCQSAQIPLPSEVPLKPRKWTQEQIVEAMANNWYLSMTHFVRYIPTLNEVVEFRDVKVVSSEYPDATFNYVLRSRLNAEEAPSTVRQIVNVFRTLKHPFAWYVEPGDTPANLSQMLLDEGLHFVEENMGMYQEVKDFPKKGSTPLHFECVATLQHWLDFDEVNIKSGESSHFEPLFRHLPFGACGEGTQIELYVGYLDKKPVVTGIAVFYAGVMGIYYVATVPEQRRKGFGSHMMEKLIKRAAERGYTIATLQATTDGKFLYEHLGFKTCCVFKEFGWNP